jgi:hypothetical protein
MIVDSQALIKFCHKNGDGSIFFPEFVEGLREPLKDRSKKIARRAFNSEGKEDKFQAPEFFVLYNASSQVGKKSRGQIISEIFESMDANNNRRIFKKEFYSYFSDVSKTYTIDEEFVAHVESVWSIAEDDDSKVFQDQLKHLTAALLLKLLTMVNGSLEEFVSDPVEEISL